VQINNKSNPSNSLYHDAKTLLGIITTASETVTLPLAEFFRSANEWLKQTSTWIWQAQSSWLYDDSNYTNFPWATTPLVNSQQDYSLPTTAQKIERVEVLDGNGNYILIPPTTREWVKTYAMTEFYKTPGMPVYYILEANSILLYPAPATGSVTLSAGLKVYFSRDVEDFVTTDTTRIPGFSENFHRILSVGAALDFATSRQMINSVNILTPKLNSLRGDLQEFYKGRETEIKPNFIIHREETI
jgi:hypothetical protein